MKGAVGGEVRGEEFGADRGPGGASVPALSPFGATEKVFPEGWVRHGVWDGQVNAYPEEIDERLAREAYWTPERGAEEMPFTRRTGD